MYHLELRQFPNHACRFNLSEQELHAIVEPWTRQQIIEVGERKWAPERATLTVLQGPRLETQQLAMGRGWRAAQRSGEDVTERVLAGATRAAQSATPSAAAPPSPARSPAAGSAPAADPLALAVQLASLLGGDPERLLAAWREVAARSSGLTPSEALALAERQIASSRAGEG
jgi:hypothetical protein